VVLAVAVVSDAEDLVAGARLGSADRVAEADELVVAGSSLGDEAHPVAGRSPVMFAMAMSKTATKASAAAPPAIHRPRPDGGWSGDTGAVTVVGGTGSGLVA
jgi:hypothetical protein